MNTMAETALADASMSESHAVEHAVRATYYAFVLWIPVETLYVFNAETESDPGRFTVSRLLGLLLFGLALLQWRHCFRRMPAAFWMIAWYIGVFALSQLWIPRVVDAWFLVYRNQLIQLLALFLISMNLFENTDFRDSVLRFYGWWISLIAGGMLLGAFGALFLVEEGRSSIAGQDPNFVASLFALGAICIAGDQRIFAPKWFIARIGAALLALSVVILAILQTGSRGGALAFVAGMLGLAICGSKDTRQKRILIAGALIAMCGFMVLREFQNDTIAASRLSKAWNEGDTTGRTEIYQAAWPMFLEKPFLGYGGANNYFALGLKLKNVKDGVYNRDTHNLFLSLLTEVGLVGAVPFLAAILYALWGAWRYGRQTGAATPFALMCALITINTSLTWHHEKIFWIVFAAAAACALDRDGAAEPASSKIIAGH